MKRTLCCILAMVLAVALFGCSGGGELSEEDFNSYDANGNLLEEFEISEINGFQLGSKILDQDELTKRGIGLGSSQEEFESAYKGATNELFQPTYPLSSSYSFKSGDMIARFSFNDSNVSFIGFETVDEYQTMDFYLLLIALSADHDSILASYKDFTDRLTSEETELLQLISLHTDTDTYDFDEQFLPNTISDLSSAAWLTAVQQKHVMELYQKFVEVHDFGF